MKEELGNVGVMGVGGAESRDFVKSNRLHSGTVSDG